MNAVARIIHDVVTDQDASINVNSQRSLSQNEHAALIDMRSALRLPPQTLATRLMQEGGPDWAIAPSLDDADG